MILAVGVETKIWRYGTQFLSKKSCSVPPGNVQKICQLSGQEIDQKSGKCRGGGRFSWQTVLLTSCLGLFQCLIAAYMRVYYAVKYGVINHSLGMSVTKSHENVHKLYCVWRMVTLC